MIVVSSGLTDKDIAEVILMEKLKISVSIALGRSMLDEMQLSSSFDCIIGAFVNKLQTYVTASKLADDKYSCYFYHKEYTSWWQHFKQDVMPKWFVRKFPVKTKTIKSKRTVKFTRYATYPMSNVILKKDNDLFYKFGGVEVIKDIVEEKR